MNQYKKSRLIVAASIFLVLSSSLLFLTIYQGVQIPYITGPTTRFFSSVNAVLAKPVQYLSEQKENLSQLLSTFEENKELKKTLADLNTIADENSSLKSENASLRQNLAISEQYTDKTLISALVSVRTPVAWNKELMLDAGQKKGLSSEMLVVANGGLIGTISSLSEDATTVKLLTNSDNVTKLAVKIATSSGNIYGILNGYDTDTHSLIISQLNSSDEIPKGSNVVTSDLAGNTPSNVQVGKVTSVKTNASDLSRELYVEPTADFSTIYAVTVVGN